MPFPKSDPYNNLLLRNMSGPDLALLGPHMERVGLKPKDCLERRGSLVRFVDFLEQGVASIVVKMAGRGNAEAGLLGFEGMSGTSLVLGDDTAIHDCVVQLPGEAIRIPAEAFRNALKQSPTLREFLLRYVEALGVQTAYTAIANARLTIEERLARWFLMCHDRVAGDSLPLTHEFLAVMLGVRRPGFTVGNPGSRRIDRTGGRKLQRAQSAVRSASGSRQWGVRGFGLRRTIIVLTACEPMHRPAPCRVLHRDPTTAWPSHDDEREGQQRYEIAAKQECGEEISHIGQCGPERRPCQRRNRDRCLTNCSHSTEQIKRRLPLQDGSIGHEPALAIPTVNRVAKKQKWVH
jgi:CRP-like cAMP-binding protein